MITFDASGQARFDSDESFDSGYRRFDEAFTWTFDSTRARFDYMPAEVATRFATNRGEGYWAPVYWNQAYYNEAYWADTQISYVDLGRGAGGDDIPYRSRRNKGWNKTAWLKKQKLLLDIEASLRGTPYEFDALGIQERFNVPPEIHVHVSDEYDKLLARLREIDDEEAMLLL